MLWRNDTNPYNNILTLRPRQPWEFPYIEISNSVDLKYLEFLELTGSGVGDQYIFRGDMNLGWGSKGYTLYMYSRGPEWGVERYGSDNVYPEGFDRNIERQMGCKIAQQLVLTLPTFLYASMGFRHSLEWLTDSWNNTTS